MKPQLVPLLLSIALNATSQSFQFKYFESDSKIRSVRISLTTKSAEYINSQPNPTAIEHYTKDFFRRHRKVILIDYERQSIVNLLTVNTDSLLEQGYVSIKSKFSSNGLAVICQIRRNDIKVNFETALEEGIVLEATKNLNFLSNPRILTISSFYPNLTFAKYTNRGIGIMDAYFGNSVLVAEKVDSALGYDFLKGFIWIIDFKGKRVFARKNSIGIGSTQTLSHE